MVTLAEILRQTGYAKDGTLVAPATQSPMTKALSEHIKTLPQQLATNQQAMNKSMGGMFKTDMATGQPNPNYYPEAISEVTQLIPNFMGATAYHGTPHKILGKFDINKVGTGEGAQAYGHGMYFAENPNVAIQYKNILSKPEFTKTGEGIELRGQLPRMLDESYGELVAKNGIQQTNYGDVTDIVGQRLDRQMKDALKANDMDWYNKTADMKLDLRRFIENPPENTGNLYKVDIPDADIPNMLDWDKPLSKQTKAVQDALAKIDKDLYHPNGSDYDPEELGQMVYSRLKAIKSAKGSVEADKAASEMLNNMGVKGIRYLDEGSRAKGGTSNFVVFDPSTIKILEENSKPVSRKELIEKQVKKLKD
jgi:hypothetical protein